MVHGSLEGQCREDIIMVKKDLGAVSRRTKSIRETTTRQLPQILKTLGGFCMEHQRPIQYNISKLHCFRNLNYSINILSNISGRSEFPYEIDSDSTCTEYYKLSYCAYPKYNMKQLVRYYV